jgi:hypothetical protein
MENHPTEANRKSDKNMKMELDWTHIPQRSRSNRENNIRLESSGIRRGRPKRTWRRTIEDEIRETGRSWNEVKGIAGDRNAWKLFIDALCSTRSKRT